MLSISDDALRSFVTYLKLQESRGELEVGKSIINIKVGEAVGPEELSQSVRRNARAALMLSGYISRVGNILSGKGIINNKFSADSVDHIVEFTLACVREDNTGTHHKEPFKIEEPEQSAFGWVNLWEEIDRLTRVEKINLRDWLTEVLDAEMGMTEQALAEGYKEFQKLEQSLAAVRNELVEVKVQRDDAREALGRSRTSVAPRVVERLVKVTPPPLGAEPKIPFSKASPGIIVRKGGK